MENSEELIAELNGKIRNIEKAYKRDGSTYSLIVDVSKMTIDLLFIVLNTHGTKQYDKAFKLHKKGHALRKKLLGSISIKDLHVLSKHGNTDADWIIAERIRNERLDDFNSDDISTREAVWSEYLNYLERGILVYKMDEHVTQRMLFVSDEFLKSVNPDVGKAIFYLEIVAEEAADPDAAEAHYKLWSIHLDEFDDISTAKAHLQAAVSLKHPEALAAYGSAHWGDWLVDKNDREAFKLIKMASELGSDWGSELLAMAYYDGLGTKKNAPKAFQIRMSLGENYNAENCCLLAEHFLSGVGVKQDEAEGNRLLRKSMKMGSGHAHWVAANEILFSEDREKLAKKRFKILKAAQEVDDPFVLTFKDLGVCYFHGDGTKQDFEKAKDCFQSVLDIGATEDTEAYAELYMEALAGKNPEDELKKILDED